MRPKTPFPVTENKIHLKWSERGQLISALSDIKQVHTALVDSRRNLKNKEQYRVLCMTLGSLEIFLLGTGPDEKDGARLSSAAALPKTKTIKMYCIHCNKRPADCTCPRGGAFASRSDLAARSRARSKSINTENGDAPIQPNL